MKTRIALFLLFVLILAACAPAATPTVTKESTVQSPTETAPSVSASPVPTATTAPPMQVGDVKSYSDGTTLVAVPAGEFTMGSNGNDDPQHSVTLPDYWIYSTLVTNQQYAVCVQLGKCTPPDPNDDPGYVDIRRANHPVTGVTYDQAAAYCSFVGGRLPTEAEWEKAAGDSKGDIYPWGNQAPACDLANFSGCVKGKTDVTQHTGGASHYGALDMLGNVYQWVADWYDANYYQNSPAENPTGPASGTARVVRSGGFDTGPDGLSIFRRGSEDPQTHRSDIGFRCVVSQPDQFAPFCEAPLMYGADAGKSTCPDLALTQEELCAKNFPYTNVTITGAAEAKIDSKGCIATDKPDTVSCQPPSTVSSSAQCQVDISGTPSCPAGYSLQGKTCVVDGGAQGACPAGLNFDSARQCCSVPAGTDTSLKTAVCPVGTYYLASRNACFPNPVPELVTVTAKVKFKDCSAKLPGGGGGGGTPSPACNQPPDQCIYQRWDPQQCKCVPL